jgi:hypothetical protein
LNDVRLIQDNIHGRKKHFAQFVGFNVSLNSRKDLPRPTLVKKFRRRRHKRLAVDDFERHFIVEAKIALIRPNSPGVLKDCVHATKVAAVERLRKSFLLTQTKTAVQPLVSAIMARSRDSLAAASGKPSMTIMMPPYKGPIGLQCYGIGGDTRDHLARSLAAWRKMNPALD